jgi:ATP-dependent DNA helicase RecG
MRSTSEIRALLHRLEGAAADDLEDEELEFKPWEDNPRDLTHHLREAVVCLANQRGGVIVVGVRDRVRTRRQAIQGIGTYDASVLRRAVYDGTDPHVLVEVEPLVEPEGTLLLVRVPKGMPPHTTSEGMAKIRIGKECKPLTGRLLARLLATGAQQDFTAEIADGATLGDLDPPALKALRELVKREAQARSLSALPDRELLEALGLVRDDGVTRAGLLLLGRATKLHRHLPQHEITFLRLRSATRYDQRVDLREPLITSLGELERLVAAHNRIRTVQEDGFGQLEFPDLSWEVAREAVLNAVAHRDYFPRQAVVIRMHRDRLEIDSPGGFVGGVTAENVLRHPPVHRNPLLAEALHKIGLVNRVGMGVDRIYEGLLRLGKDVPRYSADEAHVRLSMSLESNPAFALFLAEQEKRGHHLSLDQLLALHALVRRPTLDRRTAASWLQLGEDDAARLLAELRQVGYLVAHGRGGTASYHLRRDLAERLRGRAAVDSEVKLDEEAVALRIVALLHERGSLTNAEIRRFSGFNRSQVYRLVKELEVKGRARIVGHGRGARVIAVPEE